MFSRDKKAREGLEELNRKFEELQHKFKLLTLEWEEAYERINHSLRKLGRRAEVLQKEMDGGKPPLSPDEERLAEGTGLSARQAAINQAILRKRRLNGVLPAAG